MSNKGLAYLASSLFIYPRLGSPTVTSDFAGYSEIVPMSLIPNSAEKGSFCNLTLFLLPTAYFLLLPGKY